MKGNKQVLQKYFPNPVTRKLADSLHYAICGYNHTDGCSYGYEHWENDRLQPNSIICYTWDAHVKAYKEAEKLMDKLHDEKFVLKFLTEFDKVISNWRS